MTRCSYMSDRPFKIYGLLVAALALASCGGRPHGVLTPVDARASGTSEVDMLVVTTRSPQDARAGELFTGERGDRASFADIAISIPPDEIRQIGEVQWPQEQVGDPSREFVTLRADVLDEKDATFRFDARVRKTPKRQALVFVHGFNTNFAEAVYRFAQIVHDADISAVPVLFTWPSRGSLFAYGYDHESASYSRDALETLLQRLASDTNVGEVSVLAHSMGNWATMEALRQMAIRNGRISPKIKNVMLAAPDVDFDVFHRQIAQIGARNSTFSLFTSRDDEALGVSRRVWGDRLRTGAIDVREERFASVLAKEGVAVIDLTDVNSSDPLRHGKFASAPEVVRSIGARLASGQALSDSKAGIGDKFGGVAMGAASAIGTAASIAIVTPLAIVDPRTRESMTERFEQLGDDVEDTVNAGVGAVQAPLK